MIPPAGVELRGRLCASALALASLLLPAAAAQRGAAARVHYGLDEGVLVRIEGGERSVPGCTDAAGPGRVHGAARSPHGTLYVAAERGLYALSDDTEYLTPLALGEGAPGGEPVGVAVDGRGVVWLATTEGFGAVDPVHLVGSVVHAGPCSSLRRLKDGRLRVETADGVLLHSPRSEPLAPLELVGKPSATPEGQVHLEVRWTGEGPPPQSFGLRELREQRYRFQSDSSFERTADPGPRTFEVIARDADLASTPPLRVSLRVPVPPHYDSRLLVLAPLLVGLLLVAALLARARALGGGRVRYIGALLGSYALLVLGLQVLAGIVRHGRSWPFIGFAMYADVHREGDAIFRPKLFGIERGGLEREVFPFQAGLASDGYWQALLPLVYDGDAACAAFVEAFNERHPTRPLRGLVVEDHKHVLTSQGPLPVAPVVMRVYDPEASHGR